MKRETTCTFTGHRPEKLPWGDNEGDDRCAAVKEQLEQTVNELYDRGYRHFICGMARGGDFYFAEAVLLLRARRENVTLEAAIPCPEQADRWSEEDRQRYRELVELANFETIISPTYVRECMFQRNHYMVSKSNAIIALFNGSKGGTMNTVLDARRRGLEIIMIDPEAV